MVAIAVVTLFVAILAGMGISVCAFGTGGKRPKVFEDIYFSVEDVNGMGIVYTKGGDYSAVLKIKNPIRKYSASKASYYEFTDLFTSLLQLLGEGYALHKQDVFVRKQFDMNKIAAHEDKTAAKRFLSDSYFRFFNGRTYVAHETYLIITQKGKSGTIHSYDTAKWKDFLVKLQKVHDRLNGCDVESSFLGAEDCRIFADRFFAMDFNHSRVSMSNFRVTGEEIGMGNNHLKVYSLLDVDQVGLPGMIRPYSENQVGNSILSEDLLSALDSLPDVDTLVYNQVIFLPKEQYNALPDMEKSNYAVHAHRQRHHVYNIDQTILSASDSEQYSALLKANGQKIEKFVETAKNASSPQSALQFIKDQEQKHPEVVVFIKKGSSYEIYGDKAKTIAPVIGIQDKEKEIDGKKTSYLSFPSYALDTVLPKVIRAGNRVAICDNPLETKISKDVAPATKILSHAYQIADAVCKASGIKNERVHVLQDAKFDSKENTLFISGMSKTEGNEQVNAIMKANDIFRSVVATTGDAKRLDRSGRNSLLPADDAKHELLIRELSAGVLMARQGLPATLSKESQQLIPYWERELRENGNLMGMIERDVNNAIETIDNLVEKREVNYDAIRGQLPTKDVLLTGKDYSISADLNKLPSMEAKEMVVVLDRKQQTADVILPSGASLLVNNEVQGMSKKRIGIALKKEDVKEVSFYNAGGSLALKEPNSYYKDKEVTVSKLKQFTLEIHQTIDVSSQLAEKQATKIEKFQAIQDSEGKYAFFIKPENEKSFSIYPMKEHLNAYFNVMGKDNKQEMHQALAQKYYDIGYRYPESKQQLIVPNTEGIDMSRIEKVRICADKDDPKVKVVIATVDGERMQKPIAKQQWYNLWLADDMAEYKKAVAAVTFIPQIQQTAGNNQQQVLENEGRNVPEKEPGEKEDSHQEASSHRGFHR